MPHPVPRAEHPRPQLYRDSWKNLNGEWDFCFDFSKSGIDRKFYESGVIDKKIVVPFCPESKLSGINFTDFIPAVWYRRAFNIPAARLNGRVLLNFGAVDYDCRVYVNGAEAGAHAGGYSSFTVDITARCKPGKNILIVYAEDDNRSGKQPRGKQCPTYDSARCDYTRTTGIWQTVWLEYVPETYIKRLKIDPDLNNQCVHITCFLNDGADGAVSADASFNGQPAGSAEAAVNGRTAALTIPLASKHVWDLGAPNLYDLTCVLKKDGKPVDSVKSYFGLRNIFIKDNVIWLNDRPVFQRLVLDQGFYPDGVYTAPTDGALKNDIILSQNAGFNGARLHQKAFEERFLYHADTLGYLVWGEHASWGLDIKTAEGLKIFLPEWLELVERDYNHPSVIGWCPFNETNASQCDDVLRAVYLATKAADPVRPVIDTSGYVHVLTDVYDDHDYNQDIDYFNENYKSLKKGEIYSPHNKDNRAYDGQPFFISEYGGAWWSPAMGGSDDTRKSSWGYGAAPESEEAFLARYRGLTEALLFSKGVCAFCYTQLTDVEQEQNGIYTYDRKPKFKQAVYDEIRRINTQKAAIEE